MNQRYKNMLNDAARRFDAASNTTAAAQYDDTDTGRCAECDGALDTTFGNICEDCTAPASPSGRGDSGVVQFQIGGYYPTRRADGLRMATINIPSPDGGGQDVAEVLEPYAEKFVRCVNGWEAMRDALKNLLANPTRESRREAIKALALADPQQ